jgi:hypothetical protein
MDAAAAALSAACRNIPQQLGQSVLLPGRCLPAQRQDLQDCGQSGHCSTNGICLTSTLVAVLRHSSLTRTAVLWAW